MLDGLATEDVQDEHVSGHLLILLDLKNIPSLQAAPVRQLERAIALGKYKFLNRLTVDRVRRFFPFTVGQDVHQASDEDADADRGNNMAELVDVSHSRYVSQEHIEEQDQMVERKN